MWTVAGANSFRKGRGQDLADHPTVKPTALVMDAILDVSGRREIVLDCFAARAQRSWQPKRPVAVAMAWSLIRSMLMSQFAAGRP